MNFFDLARDILLEYSPNDPIPELNRRQKGLGIFLVGPPASGKTRFREKFIEPKQGDIKTFSTDDIAKTRKGEFSDLDLDPGEYPDNTSDLRHSYVKSFVQSSYQDNFILDTTGIDPNKETGVSDRIKEVYDLAKENGYDIIFIHLLTSVGEGIARVRQRNRDQDQPRTDIEYAKKTYTGPEDMDRENFAKPDEEEGGVDWEREPLSTKMAQKIMTTFTKWGNDPYYIILNLGRQGKFLKYEGGKIKVYSGDEYVPVNKQSS